MVYLRKITLLIAATAALGAAAATTTAPAKPPAKPITLQVKTMDFKGVADMVLNRLTTARFAGTTGNTGGILVRPAERILLAKLKASATQLQAHPHDIKLAVRMMSDLNSALFMSDVTVGNRGGTRGNEKTIQPFFDELRDAAASAGPVMVVVNIAGNADHLLNQQKVDNDGNLAVTPGTTKPTPWLNPDTAADKKLITQLTNMRDAALEILELDMKDGNFIDRIQSTDLADGTHLEGIIKLSDGKFDGTKLVDPKPADDLRTLGKLQPADIEKLTALLEKFPSPGNRPRYVEFLNADKRILDATIKKTLVQTLSLEPISFAVSPATQSK